MNRNIVTGIDIGTRTINIAVLELPKNETKPKILALVSRPSGGLRKGNVTDLKIVSVSLKTAIKDTERIIKLPIKSAYVGISGPTLASIVSRGLIATSKADGEITDSDVKRAIHQSEVNIPKLSNKSIVHTFPWQFYIDKDLSVRNPVGMKGGKLEVDAIFIVCLTQHLNSLIKSVEANNVAVNDFIASPFASARAVLTRRQREVGSLVLDFGAETTSIIVFEDDIPISAAVFPFGSEHITNDIALYLQVPLEEAENIKHSYGADSSFTKKIAPIVEARLSDVIDLVGNHLKKIGRSEMLPAGAVLVGEGSLLPTFPVFVKRELKIPVQTGEYDFLKQENIGVGWSCAIGLALLGLDEKQPMIDTGQILSGISGKIKSWFKTFVP